MVSSRDLLDELRVKPGSAPRLDKRQPDARVGAASKQEGLVRIAELVERLGALHTRLYAEAMRAVLLVIQGMDASGKDGTIRTVFTGVNPQGCRVQSFKAPTVSELAHDYLWRIHNVCPARGEIGIFNRSHYEDVVAVRLHALAPEEVWSRRPGHIREWERMLADEGTTLVKVFLNVSKEEQQQRLQERVDDPEKRWKFRTADLDVRRRFDDYVAAWNDVIAETSTEWAPWHVVPADRNWVKSTAVATLLAETLERLDPKLPEPEAGLDGLVIK